MNPALTDNSKNFVFKWHLDWPNEKTLVNYDGASDLEFRGWIIAKDDLPVRLAIRKDGVDQFYALNENRPDVIRKVLGSSKEDHPRIMCGFKHLIGFSGHLDLGFEFQGKIHWVKSLTVRGIEIKELKLKPDFNICEFSNPSSPVGSNLVQRHTFEYYYSVFNMHISHFINSTASANPRVVAEIGPGYCLAAGLTALMAGATELYAFDTVAHCDRSLNCEALHEISKILRERRKPINADHFPSYSFTLDSRGFASRIFTEDILNRTLQDQWLKEIEKVLLGDISDKVIVREIIPWQSQIFTELEGKIDFIFSHSVMEHIDDVEDAYSRMFRYLRPGGGISHSIDLKSHSYAHKFNGHLAIKRDIFEKMRGGQPYAINRILMSEHIQLIEDAGFKIVMLIIKTNCNGIEHDEVAEDFLGISNSDLMCGNLFIQAIKQKK